MFINKVGKPTKTKNSIYLMASIVLGLLLSLNLHVLIEVNYLKYLSAQGRIAVFYGGCALPPVVQGILLLLGILGGFFLGRFWWRIIYIERFWEKKKKIK